jgi:putative ABC transport system substrate-binding protein
MPAIPIISATLIDPIGAGLVTSHARPGGNVTGTLISFETLLGKQLELAREVIPGASRIGMLLNPNNPVNCVPTETRRSHRSGYGCQARAGRDPLPEDLDPAFRTFEHERSESCWSFRRDVHHRTPTHCGARVGSSDGYDGG